MLAASLTLFVYFCSEAEANVYFTLYVCKSRMHVSYTLALTYTERERIKIIISNEAHTKAF